MQYKLTCHSNKIIINKDTLSEKKSSLWFGKKKLPIGIESFEEMRKKVSEDNQWIGNTQTKS